MEGLNKENTIIIACSMLDNEIRMAMEQEKCDIPVLWMDKGLHEYPDKLRSALREEVLKYQDKEWIVLLYGLCGNGTLGITSPRAKLVIPNYDDCIRMILSLEEGGPIVNDPRCLYYTENWLDREGSLIMDTEKYTREYGDKKGRKILKCMLGNYRGVKLIDTGAYDLKPCSEIVKKSASDLGLEFGEVEGTVRVIKKLCRGSLDGEFCVIPPGIPVDEGHFAHRARCVDGIFDTLDKKIT